MYICLNDLTTQSQEVSRIFVLYRVVPDTVLAGTTLILYASIFLSPVVVSSDPFTVSSQQSPELPESISSMPRLARSFAICSSRKWSLSPSCPVLSSWGRLLPLPPLPVLFWRSCRATKKYIEDSQRQSETPIFYWFLKYQDS